MSSRSGTTSGDFWADADDDVALSRFRTLVNAVEDGIYQLDEAGRFVAVNDEIVATTGYTRADLLGEHVSLLLAEEHVARVERAMRDRMESNLADPTVEITVQTADGRALPCEVRVSPVLEDGAFAGSFGVVRTLSAAGEAATRGDRAAARTELFGSVLDEIGSGVFVLDEEFHVAWADDTVCEFFGLERADLVGRDKREVVRELSADVVEDGERFADRVLSTYEDNNEAEVFECHVTGGENRRERWLEHRSSPIESGEYAGGRIELYSEITDRKRSADALKETEERFQSLVDAVEEYAIFRLDADGRVISWNRGAEEIKGYDESEIVGEHFSTFYTEADREAGVPERNLTRAMESGSVEDEGWRVRQDGSRFWANVTISSVRGDDGTHRGFLKVTRDMTDRYRHEKELESELQRILGRISDAFFAVDETFEFTHVNERAQELLQYPEEELLGETLWEVFPDVSEDDEVRQAFETALTEQEPVNVEFYHESLYFWIEANLYPSETGISVYFRDVTDRREYERKLEESNERLEQFAYAASHDLQEPLRMVSSYLRLVDNRYGDELDEDGQEFLEFAVDGADRMRDMIDGLLQYSRVDSRGDPLEPTDLNAVVADVRDDLRVKIEEYQAEITVEELPRVLGDVEQLRQLFQNLFDNAIEYSGDAPPRVHVSVDRRGDQWEIHVSDEGIGIDPDEADRVFEVFQRLHGSDEEGSGIGLSLCERIVERHGGEIWVESEPGEGATFSFTLDAAGETDE